MLTFTHTEGRVTLRLRMLFMGQDICILLDGGEKPHMGALTTAYAQGTEHICLPGHREDILAQKVATKIQKTRSCTVTCLCGIHIPDITKDEIALVYKIADILLHRCLQHL